MRNGDSDYYNASENTQHETLDRVKCRYDKCQNQNLCCDTVSTLKTMVDQLKWNVDKCHRHLGTMLCVMTPLLNLEQKGNYHATQLKR